MLKKRLRRYYCAGCKHYQYRISDKRFYTSFCGYVQREICMVWKPTK